MRWLKKLGESVVRHKFSLLISLTITFLGVTLYVLTYVVERDWAVLKFIHSIELKSYDTRFRLRGTSEPSANIAIVAIDQETLERFGSWPFSRRRFVPLLDRLKADGAKVIAFDLNFPRPDDKSGLELVLEAKREYLGRTPARQRDSAYVEKLEEMEREADADGRFADALRRAGNAVLGYFFFPDRESVRILDEKGQQEADSYLAFSSYSLRIAKEEGESAAPPLEEIFPGREGYLAETNLLQFTDAVDFSTGYFNFEADADGIFRRAPLAMMYREGWRGDGSAQANFYPSLDIQVARRYLDVPEHEMVLFSNKAGVEAVFLGEHRVPTDAAGQLLIHYQGGPFTYPHFSMADVAEGNFATGTFRNRIVLIGATALGIADLHPTPFAESYHSGVEIHANLIDTLLSGRFIHRGEREMLIDLGILVLLGLGVGWVLAWVPPSWTAPITIGMMAVFSLFAYWALAHYQVWLNYVVPASTLVMNFASVTAYRVLIEEKQKRQTYHAFGQFVPPAVVRELMKDPERLKLGGEERELTIMFSDIRGFTALTERLSPLELTRFLNSYTDEMTEIIFHHRGTLDKFEGDAIMAFWGAPYEQPDHMLRACAAALDMSRRVDQLRPRWNTEGKGNVDVGVGLSTGRVVVGNMGSKKRFNYTVLGDPVNLASRLEGVNKEYSTRILVSEATYRQALDAVGILEKSICREFGVSAQELRSSESADRARQVALYICSRQRLAPRPILAERFGVKGEAGIHQVAAQVEKWASRDKKLASTLAFLRRSFRPLVFRPLDWIRVQGRNEPVRIYEVLGGGGEEDRWKDLLTLFEAGLEAYRSRHWSFALDAFRSVLEKYPDDGPSRLFAERCRKYMEEEPDPAWDGVYAMKTK